LGRLGDVDGDDDIDVTYGGDGFGALGDIGWVENPGTAGAWIRHDIDDSSLLQQIPTGLADIDGDGDTDIVGYTFNVSTVIGDALWYSNPAITSSVAEDADDLVPETFSLGQNYPNPFNPVTVIKYEIPIATSATLSIHNILGEEVARLADGPHSPGSYEASFDASSVSSGFYFYRLTSEEFVEVRKMVVLK